MAFRTFALGFLASVALLSAPAFATALSVESVDVIAADDFVIEPAKIEIFADSGETITKYVTIINRVAGESHFMITLEDFVGSEDPTVAVKLLGDEISRYTFKKNIVPEVQNLTLSFGEKAVIPVTISIPESASPGGYYTSVIVARTPEDDTGQGGTGAKTVSRIAQLLFVRVNGPVFESGTLLDFLISPTSFFHVKGPLAFNILFENTGNVHLAPYGYISVRNMFGGIVAQIPVDAYYSLPESQRYREIVWNHGFLFGYYTATLELSRGYQEEEDAIDTLSTSFMFVPVPYIVILIVAVLALLLIRRYLRTHFEIRRK